MPAASGKAAIRRILGAGLPYIQGLYILSEDATGRPIAIMDSRWITGNRTAAATAVAAKHLARRDSKTLAILGCGLQGRKNVEALRAVLPGLNRCQAYDIIPERERAFVAEMRERFAIEALGAGSAEAAVRGADIVITAGPIEERRKPVIVPAWLKPGSLVVTLDYDFVHNGRGRRRDGPRAHRRPRADRRRAPI